MTTITPLDDNPQESIPNSKEKESQHEHEDHRLFGLIAFLVADGMTFAGFFCSLLDL